MSRTTKAGIVMGLGISDADYRTQWDEKQRLEDGTVITVHRMCPFYLRWVNMLKRSYSPVNQKARPSYKDCEVCDEWLTFSKFKAWMETQDWEGKQLDKDLLVEGNRLYSPETCVFVSMQVNSFLLDNKHRRGNLPLGVYKPKGRKYYVARTKQNGKVVVIGHYSTPDEAHIAWKKRKYELALILASKETDPRIIEALVNRYKE